MLYQLLFKSCLIEYEKPLLLVVALLILDLIDKEPFPNDAIMKYPFTITMIGDLLVCDSVKDELDD